MRIPKDPDLKSDFIAYIISVCMASQDQRKALYDKRFRYYTYGNNTPQFARHNRLYSHIGLVASFLYSQDSFNYALSAPRNADDIEIKKITALQDSFNQDIQDDGLADVISEAVECAIVWDTAIFKQGWNDTSKQNFGIVIEPESFGVWRESITDFGAQPAMCHEIFIDRDEAIERLIRAGKPGMIDKLDAAEGEGADRGLPNVVSQLIVSSTGGSNLAGNVTGEVNPDTEAAPSFRAFEAAPVVALYEVWIWDSEYADYRSFEVLGGGVILSDSLDTINALKAANGKAGKDYASACNLFLPKENPFTPITPFKMKKYFWGDCHIEHIIPLQNWSNERLTQIESILQQQADPSKVFSGFMGGDDEKFGALGSGDNWVSEAMPGAKVDRLFPEMPPDLFQEYEQIGGLMLEASGITENIAGKGTGGARGGKQNKQLQITGGGRIRKVATGLEQPLVRIGDIGLRLKQKNDDNPMKLEDGTEFLASQVDSNYDLRVDGHSHSPLFTMENEELATLLLKAKAIDQEGFIRMLRPPGYGSMLHSLHKRQAAEAKAKQQADQLAAQTGKPPPKPGK